MHLILSHSDIIHMRTCDCLCVLPFACVVHDMPRVCGLLLSCLCVQVHARLVHGMARVCGLLVCAFKLIVWCGCGLRGVGRYGYEVRRAGGGIGAGFPSVSFCSTVPPGSYLVPVKRYWCWFGGVGGVECWFCCVNNVDTR